MALRTFIAVLLVLAAILIADHVRADHDDRAPPSPSTVDPNSLPVDVGSLPVIQPEGI